MSKYIYDEQGICTNGDAMYYKSDGILAHYEVAKNKHGYARTFEVQGSIISICRPLSWEEEDVTSTKEEAIALAKYELKKALISSNYNGQFDGLLIAMGEVVEPKNQVIDKPQLSLF